MHHTRLHGSAQRIDQSPVGGQVTGTGQQAVLVQVVLADLLVEDQFVGCGLDQFGGRVELVEEDQPAVVILGFLDDLAMLIEHRFDLDRQLGADHWEQPGERSEVGHAIIVEAGQTREVFRGTGGETVVNDLQVQLFGNRLHDRGFAQTRRRLKERHQTGIQTVQRVFTGQPWGSPVHVTAHWRTPHYGQNHE
ncbi:hypothetical protein D3C84_655060 [compost metagenome]